MKITEAMEELKKLAKGEYCTTEYHITNHQGEDIIECCLYFEEVGHFRAPTFDMALEKVKEAMGKIEPDSLDIDG